MSKSSRPQGGARAGRAKVDEVRQEQRAKERRSRLILIAAVWAVVLLIAGIVGFTVYNDVSNRPTLDAVKTYTVTRDHTTDPVTYAQTPPVGGNHAPTWLNCGVYTSPVKNELAVHALEHGAVWVTYDPDLPADQVAKLTAAIPDTYMVLSPYDGPARAGRRQRLGHPARADRGRRPAAGGVHQGLPAGPADPRARAPPAPAAARATSRDQRMTDPRRLRRRRG